MSNGMVKSATGIGSRAREDFDEKQIKLIQATVARDATVPELHMFLELAARYQLDPFAGQIYCAKVGSKNADGGRVAIITSRDGFLTIANRHPEYRGMDGDVVRENDDFKRLPDGEIQHSYEGGAEKRGKIVGAWARVFRDNRPPTYFFAPIDEYKPTGNRLTYSPWSKQESAMILKCAESMALRKAFNITGLVGEEEMARAGEAIAEQNQEAEFGDDEALAERLRAAFAEANRLKPGSFRPAKQRTILAGLDHDGRVAVAEKLEAEIAATEEAVEGEVVE